MVILPAIYAFRITPILLYKNPTRQRHYYVPNFQLHTMATLEDGFYTIIKDPNDYFQVATLLSLDPETPVVTLPPSKDDAPNQRVSTISYSYSRDSFL